MSQSTIAHERGAARTSGTVRIVGAGLLGSSIGHALTTLGVDVALADGTGIDVARAASERDIPVMFVTGNCPGDAEAYATGCLAKPYTQRALLSAINAVEAAIEGRRPGRLPSGFRLFANKPVPAPAPVKRPGGAEEQGATFEA